ncbi:MAG: hypothetical protein AAF067_14375 [Pseudomonadota bacterium]
MKKTIFLFPLASMLITGCAMQQDSFPSLSKRAIEDIPPAGSEPAPDVPTLSVLPPELQKEMDVAIGRSNTAHKDFLADLPAVEEAVAASRDAAPSSESWVVAQMKLAALETRRGPSVSALADLDALYMKRLDSEFADSQPGGAALIDRSRNQVIIQVDMQQKKIDELKAALR